MQAGKKVHVGMMFGGRSGEHEVSLMSARSVLNAIDAEKYHVTQIGITHEGVWLVGDDVLETMTQGETGELSQATFLPDPTRPGLYKMRSINDAELIEFLTELDVVFPVLHGTFGEDGTLQGLLELSDLAYVGAGVLGSSLAMDKGAFKDVMRANGIPILDWLVFNRTEINGDTDKIVDLSIRLAPFPLFVKPANLGSSVGVSKCTSRSDLYEGLLDAARFDRRVIVERGLEAREIEVSVLGNEEPQASVPGEIIPGYEFYSYEAKYLDDSYELHIPAPIAPELTKMVQELAVRAYRAIDCAGMARVDFLLDKETTGVDGLYLNELNTIPGFTKISMYPKLWDASGLPYPKLIDRLIDLAFERKRERDRTERRFRRDD